MNKRMLIALSAILVLAGCSEKTTTSDMDSSSESFESSSIFEEERKEAYAVVDSEEEHIYIYGYISQEAFDLNNIDVSALTSKPLNYNVVNKKCEVRDNKLYFSATGTDVIVASNSDVTLKYDVVINSTKDSQYKMPNKLDLSNYHVRSGAATDVSFDENSLTLTSGSTWTRVTYPLEDNYKKDYVLDVDVSFLSTNDSTRWLGVVFRDNETTTKDYPYSQFDIRRSLSNAQGVELTQVYQSNSYAYAYQGSYNQKDVLALNEKVHLTLVVQDYYAAGYIDQNLVFETTLSDNSGGDIGFQVAGAVAKFENIAISYPNELVNREETRIISYANTQASKMDFSTSNGMKPHFIGSGSNEDELMGTGDAISQMYVHAKIEDNKLAIYDLKNQKMSENINYYFTWYKGTYLPNIEVDNMETVDALSKMLSAFGIVDVAIFSKNIDVLKYAHSKLSFARFGYISSATDLSTPTLVGEECLLAGSGFATLVIVDNALLTKENVVWFTGRGYTIVADTSDFNEGDVIDATVKGASMILVYYSSQEQKEVNMVDDDSIFTVDKSAITSSSYVYSMFQAPYATGHRGAGTDGSNPEIISSQLTENTIESFEWAYEHGAMALEIDVHMTSDKKLAVIHDETTAGVSATNLTVKNSTLEQLSSLTLKNSSSHIPSLNEVFETFNAEKYADKTMVIEIKDNLYETGKAVVEMSKEYGWYGRYVMITFSSVTAKQLYDYDSSIQVGYLNTVYRRNTDEYWTAYDTYLKNGVGLSSQFSTVSEVALNNSAARGQIYWLWTYGSSNATDLINGIASGNKGFTTNYLKAFSSNPNRLSCSTNYSLAMNRSLTLTANAIAYDGTQVEASNLEAIVISDNATVNKNQITRTGDGNILVVLKYKSTWNLSPTTSTTYYLYSDIITIG